MNIIINGFLDRRTNHIAQKVLSSINVETFIFTYNYFKPNFGRLNSKAILINWRKINFMGNYDIDFNKLEPLDEDLVDAMRKYESIFMRMADRLETFKNYSYRERKSLYLKHLRYWNDTIEKKKIDLFLSQNVPHETSDFVCYCLCKLKNIPTIILCQTHIPDTCLIFDDWENTDYGLVDEFKKLKTKLSRIKIDRINLSPRFEKYYLLQTDKSKNITPFYMKKNSLIKVGTKKIQAICRKLKENPTVYFHEGGLICRSLARRSIDKIMTKILMNFYEKNCTEFKPKSKYIFVALHVQPEMSTSPRADVYVNQIMIVQLLAACAPKDVKIFVKEHPNQRALGRTKEFYQDILSLKNVSLISRKVDSKDLVKNSLAVATCVGLVGFESLFQNKPVLMFGHDFYQYAPGVFSIRTKSDLENAVKQINKGSTFKPKDFKIFLKAMDNISINGTTDSDYLPTSSLTIKENTLNIAQAIIKKNRKISEKKCLNII
ncbi:TPA: hypothetical protein DD449_03820 [Candidatus Berkelbacteria bacterium]|uniref:Capsule polysaccharide biosynthesis protein n=1 Tax=Berkelbacteria bacterium GW2011_GWE1_39_12 TaxID=1618337 RepID=A0A0G4B2L1_9BACT|nr:MAG: hypothetical protein UT28_C0001G0400 [Berkelbacteria bacterium GW2011_GWE1_39_12]HBO60784.1 hypothetical protein [Candidatus Berkelbacteria bacterium]